MNLESPAGAEIRGAFRCIRLPGEDGVPPRSPIANEDPERGGPAEKSGSETTLRADSDLQDVSAATISHPRGLDSHISTEIEAPFVISKADLAQHVDLTSLPSYRILTRFFKGTDLPQLVERLRELQIVDYALDDIPFKVSQARIRRCSAVEHNGERCSEISGKPIIPYSFTLKGPDTPEGGKTQIEIPISRRAYLELSRLAVKGAVLKERHLCDIEIGDHQPTSGFLEIDIHIAAGKRGAFKRIDLPIARVDVEVHTVAERRLVEAGTHNVEWLKRCAISTSIIASVKAEEIEAAKQAAAAERKSDRRKEKLRGKKKGESQGEDPKEEEAPSPKFFPERALAKDPESERIAWDLQIFEKARELQTAAA